MRELTLAINDSVVGPVIQTERILTPEEADVNVAAFSPDEMERLRNGRWPDYHDFLVHPEPELLLRYVIGEYLPFLESFSIRSVMAKSITPVARRRRLGTAAKLPGKMRFLAGIDAVVTLDFTFWRVLSDKDRQRLIHHELEHLGVGEGGKLWVRRHDFEDFASVVALYGIRSESAMFSTDGESATALQRAAQLELVPAGVP